MAKFNKSSFTLVEALVTIVIMAVLIAVVMPRFSKDGFIENLTLRSASSKISSDLRYARQLAITNSGHYLVNFNFSQKEYAIYKDSVSVANLVGEIKKLPSSGGYSGTQQFDFYALGNCIYAGTGIVISYNNIKYKILADPPSGVVVLEKIS